ncbi:MAG TPA: RidA family protein [Terriglobales bacterium]|jgi:2-iminobutanoate/2-iminopropanoate deaminase|nr:RidA family protein [Terriglobales bacterium]
MAREIISTGLAPKAIGPYSQAVKASGLIFLSGQIALDPATGQIVEGGVRAQTERVLKNISAVLEGAGAEMSSVVKTVVYLKNMSDFAAMNEVYAQFWHDKYPARSTVEVAQLPRNALVEIDVIALG